MQRILALIGVICAGPLAFGNVNSGNERELSPIGRESQEVVKSPGQPITSDSPRGGELELEIERTPENLSVGQALLLRISITNVGREPLYLERLILPQAQLLLTVRDSIGKAVPFRGSDIRTTAGPPRSIHDFLRLDPGYSYGIRDIRRKYPVIVSRPGVYTVQGTLSVADNGPRLGLDCWSGTVHSKPIRLIIAGK
jgi:hypothetical protein